MTFKTVIESDHMLEKASPDFCGRINVEVDLCLGRGMQIDIDYLHIEFEGQLYPLSSLSLKDQQQINEWLTDMKSQYQDYHIDMLERYREMDAEISTDEVG